MKKNVNLDASTMKAKAPGDEMCLFHGVLQTLHKFNEETDVFAQFVMHG